MSTSPAYIGEDKKDPVLANPGVLESGNESDSIDTITALVIEGTISTLKALYDANVLG